MSLYKPFGVGKIKDADYWIEATDYVVPNSQLDSLKNSAASISEFRTLLSYLDVNSSEKKPLKFAIESRYGAEFRYRECHVDEGHVLSVIVEVDNYQQIFLSQQFKRKIREKGLSVVRHQKDSTYSYPEIDTTRSIFEMPKRGYNEFRSQPLFQDYWQYPGLYDGFVSDYITKKTALTQFAESDYSYTVIGSFEECMKVGDYFPQKNFPERGLPFNFQIMSLSKGYWRDNDILAIFRLVEKGKEIFLSREGYRFLKEGGFVIIRAKKQAEDAEWKRLDILLDPEVIK